LIFEMVSASMNLSVLIGLSAGLGPCY